MRLKGVFPLSSPVVFLPFKKMQHTLVRKVAEASGEDLEDTPRPAPASPATTMETSRNLLTLEQISSRPPRSSPAPLPR